MRWGIRNENSVDHSASYRCMKEIETCKSVSWTNFCGKYDFMNFIIDICGFIIDIILLKNLCNHIIKMVLQFLVLFTNCYVFFICKSSLHFSHWSRTDLCIFTGYNMVAKVILWFITVWCQSHIALHNYVGRASQNIWDGGSWRCDWSRSLIWILWPIRMLGLMRTIFLMT